MTDDRPMPAGLDGLLLCYCTNVTIAELHEACRAGRWPLPGKEATGKLCTGCADDLRQCLRWFNTEGSCAHFAPAASISGR